MRVAILEPFYSGSHKTWVDSLCVFSTLDITTFTLPGRHWKWRMGAGAVQLADSVNKSNKVFDVFLVTDMLDVAVFKSLLDAKYRNVKLVLYMHENQIVYPFQTLDSDKNRDRHYGLINYKSILAADTIWFNSAFHLNVFFSELEQFLDVFPESGFHIKKGNSCKLKSKVVPLGIDCATLDSQKAPKSNRPTVLWNHRWEYDKNPDLFFSMLLRLSEEGVDFDLNVVGEQYAKSPAVFEEAKIRLEKHIKHWGYVPDKACYYKILWDSTVLPVTANQEFFGLSVLEAMYCDVTPLLPNRLSYTDLYSNLKVFYDTNDEFYGKLKNLLLGQELKSYRDVASQYNWMAIAKQYDRMLLKVIA